MAALGARRPRRSGRNGNCGPTRVASSTRRRQRAVAVSTNSLLEDRARAQHMMRVCAPTRMSEAAASSLTAAHIINTDNKQVGQTMQKVQAYRRSLSHDKTDSTEEETTGSYPFKCVRIGREQHVPESIACTKKSPQKKKTRLPALSQAACTSTRAVACSKVADDVTSNSLHDFFHEPQHWHVHDLLHDAFQHEFPLHHHNHFNKPLLDLRLGKQDHLFLLRASNSNVWLVMRLHDDWNDCEERAQAPRK